MEHFEIILALSRMAINGDQNRVRSNLIRLRDALVESDPKQAEKLTRLISRETIRHEFAPIALERMRKSQKLAAFSLPGEKLSKMTPLPADKETGAPLARVVFPDSHDDPVPVLDSDLEAAIYDLLSEWDQIEAFEKIGIQPNTRCLIYGAPGVGKTLLARYIARELDLPLVEARLDGLVSSFLGTTARNIGALFDFADRYKCILFLDEFDAIAKARDDKQEVGEIKRVVNSLLQSLDARGSHQFTLAATNHEHLLDGAVWRRFEARIHIPLPDVRARKTILTRFLDPLRLSEPEMKLLSWLTERMSGADLETLVIGGKRYFVLHSTAYYERKGQSREMSEILLAALKRQTTLNARLFDGRRHKLLLGEIENLSEALVEEADLTQKEIATIFGVSQSTISRHLKSAGTDNADQKKLEPRKW